MKITINKNVGKKHNKIKPALLFASIIFGIYAISLLIPLIWGLVMSLQTRFQYVTDKLSFPIPPQFKNYIQAFTELQSNGNNMFVMFFNSLWLACGGAVLHVATCAITAYVCAKYKFALGKVWYWLSVIIIMVPIMGAMPASFRVKVQLGMYDSPLNLIGSINGLGMSFLIVYSFFKGVSWEYAESAMIDGAGHFRTFVQIMLPLAYAPMIALLVSDFIGSWNDATGPLVYLPSYPTLASGFYLYQIESSRALNYPVLFAGLFICAIPVVILYVLCNKFFLELQIGGGIKG